MTRRVVAVPLTGPPPASACPPGVEPAAFATALAEDVVNLVTDLAGVDPAIVATGDNAVLADSLRWPGTTVLRLPADTASPALVAALAGLAGLGYDQAALVSPDAPDLPGLVLAKPFRALTTRPVAVAPATSGGLVAFACELPVPGWLAGFDLDFDDPGMVERLKERAPRRRDVFVTPEWHRLREPADLALLDPGLEGWEATRSLLAGPDRAAR